MNRYFLISLIIISLILILVSVRYFLYKQKIPIDSFDITKKPFSESRMDPKDHNLLVSIMERTNKLFGENNLEYFMIAGSLLGSMRYGNRMPWDDDIDIGVMEQYEDKLKSLDFASVGLKMEWFDFIYKIYDPVHSRPVKNEKVFPFVDIFIYQPSGINEYNFKSSKVRNWWPNESITQDLLYPLSKCSYAGIPVSCPNKPRQYLDKCFPGWDKKAYITPNHSSSLSRTYIMPVNKKTTSQVMAYLDF